MGRKSNIFSLFFISFVSDLIKINLSFRNSIILFAGSNVYFKTSANTKYP